jgi:hypothetical protein
MHLHQRNLPPFKLKKFYDQVLYLPALILSMLCRSRTKQITVADCTEHFSRSQLALPRHQSLFRSPGCKLHESLNLGDRIHDSASLALNLLAWICCGCITSADFFNIYDLTSPAFNLTGWLLSRFLSATSTTLNDLNNFLLMTFSCSVQDTDG